ncbi:MAG: hypothetical protein UY21_C0002G0032 [Microgenomates group bacterium GW2011_GWA1_48_10]|uniref:Uncharacterized protein n=1 Tax=Candidatus Gottesmanbacteria bacterium RIFCSPHIGHO2_01_FULL_47_48 TaxID=1798381 RepID=A0A1F5ZZC4_9BACT|nr:MAG: hypothetical protein UY21_C0002G0032 [Microgenomates group bacterium GW2011_GWA1_48_10]OGG17798.1 MAG: hypothetical protein A2721_02135 [Candidatus Gottesmanbacteria bacterium RIFCSPHIGHO2_01_FULL_47_48]
MFTIFFRRLQKYSLPIKIAALLPSLYGLYYLLTETSPELLNLVIFGVLSSIVLILILSFFLSIRLYLAIGIAIPFLLFLKAVDLLTPANVIIFLVFIALMEMYLFQVSPKIKEGDQGRPSQFSIRPLFPRSWLRFNRKRRN